MPHEEIDVQIARGHIGQLQLGDAAIRSHVERQRLIDDRITSGPGVPVAEVGQRLAEHLFGPRPFAEALIAEADGGTVGFALFFHTYSTFRGQPSLYIEDIFVRPAFRGRGIGKAMLARLARLAVDRGCGRLEWAVLDWNAPSIAFYRSLGARPMVEWTIYRLDESSLKELAGKSPSTDAAEGRG